MTRTIATQLPLVHGHDPATRSRRGQTTRPMILFAAVLLGGSVSAVLAADKFEKTAVFLEQNVQDQDAEVKFEIIGSNAGMLTLQVMAPDGRTVIDFKSPASKLGLRHLTVESPEPKNDGRLQADFPEGSYKFTGTTTAGETLRGEASLTHEFPAVASIVRPRPDERNVSASGLRVTWAAVKGVETIVVLIEDEKTGRDVRATLPGNATSFAVPNGFLTGSTTYKLAIGSVGKGGNRSVTETSFTTGEK